MKEKFKKHLGILLSILMIITMIPILPIAAAELPFSDVPTSEWYYNDVKQAFETGLINGFEDNTFRPDENMTYAQAVKLAACMNQKYTDGSVTLGNGSPNWWDSYTAYAKEKGIIDKDYDWNSKATRAGYVEIFAKALPDDALKGKNSIADNAVPDVDMSHPQASAIYKLYRAGILTGNDEKGTFLPNNPIKRSEVSAILTRMMDESARKDLDLSSVTPPDDSEVQGGTITDSWSEIIASVNNGTYKNKYKIGDTKALDLGSEGVVEMQIAAFDVDELADSSGKAAITWISKQALKTEHRMNPKLDSDLNLNNLLGTGSVGGWEFSEMREWLKSTIKPLMPSNIQAAIQPVKKYSLLVDRFTHHLLKKNEVTIDDIWIPSKREIYGDSLIAEAEGPTYTGLFPSDSEWHDEFRKSKTNSDNSSEWWLRSASEESNFFYVEKSGFYSSSRPNNFSGAYDSHGVVLGFCM